MDNPLVTIFVITYNSSEFILEALDSVKNQTYHNIELVISDDCSSDNTVPLCKEWLEKNQNRFIKTVLLTSERNTGVAPNCNRAIEVSTGRWLKVLAGDDVLLSDSIENYVNFIQHHPHVKIVFGKLDFFGIEKDLVLSVKDNYEKNCYPLIKDQNVKKQYRNILKKMYVPGPGLFFNKKLWEEIGGYNENYSMAEEYPFTFEILKNRHLIYFLDKNTYGYRVRKDSICHDENNYSSTIRHNQLHFLDKRWKELLKKGMILELINQYAIIKRYENKFVKRNFFKKFFYDYMILISPLFLRYKLKTFLKKDLFK